MGFVKIIWVLQSENMKTFFQGPAGSTANVCAWQVNTEDWPWEVLVLLGYLALFRLCIYAALRRNTVLR